MSGAGIISARRQAEEAVADMADGPLKVKAFEVILNSLLRTDAPQLGGGLPAVQLSRKPTPSSLADRIDLLAEEQFFAEPRSLSEIQEKLREHGWHYPQTNLSTPLVRLVRQRKLRRLQLTVGNKKVWKYALP